MEHIFLSPPHMSGNEQKYVKEAFDTNWIAPLGPNVDGFENDIVDYVKEGYCAALTSGTAALHLALILSLVTEGDEVLCSTFTFAASANPIKYVQANPVFVDSECDTWNMDPALLKQAIEDRISITGKAPKALILVHLYGMPAQMDEIVTLCEKYNIVLIEDAAEALGSCYKGKALGTFGKFGVYSFNGNKILSTSGGGALVSNDKESIEKARFLATQARDSAPYYQHSNIGFNYRMSNIIAGVGRGQMEVLGAYVKARRVNNSWYQSIFENVKGVNVLVEPDEKFYSNHWLSCILTDETINGVSATKLISVFADANIEARHLWKPMHMQPIFSDNECYTNGCSETLFKTGVCLPSGSSLNADQKDRIWKVIQNVYK